jgi:hypothetical protein
MLILIVMMMIILIVVMLTVTMIAMIVVMIMLILIVMTMTIMILSDDVDCESVQVRGALKLFVTIKNFYSEELSAPRPTPKLEEHSLLAVRDCLFNIFVATLRTRRTSLHPQPEDAPCRGDKETIKEGFF